MREGFKLSISEFNIILLFFTEFWWVFELVLWVFSGFMWCDPSKSKDIHLRDNSLKYIHQFLAYSRFTCCESWTVFLGVYETKLGRVNLGTQFSQVSKNKKSFNFGFFDNTF